MPLLGGRLCEVAYTNPLLSPFNFFHSNQGGGGHGLLYPLAIPVRSASGAAGICQPRVKARERSDRVGGEGEVFPFPR